MSRMLSRVRDEKSKRQQMGRRQFYAKVALHGVAYHPDSEPKSHGHSLLVKPEAL